MLTTKSDSELVLKLDTPPGKSLIISFSNCIGMADFDVYMKNGTDEKRLRLNKQKFLGRY